MLIQLPAGSQVFFVDRMSSQRTEYPFRAWSPLHSALCIQPFIITPRCEMVQEIALFMQSLLCGKKAEARMAAKQVQTWQDNMRQIERVHDRACQNWCR